MSENAVPINSFARFRRYVKNWRVHIRFLLGPAGSGKTRRCLSEIHEALRASAEGPPLILLAPKQATFQLERQLLADPDLPGYTRLRIVSFERLAEFIYEQLDRPFPELLAEEGRVMVLRALLEQKRGELRLFRASARLPGFAQQLSRLLRELQNYRLSPERLETLAERVGTAIPLSAKLRDLALVLRAYLDWLKGHQLQDADRLLDLAAEEAGASSRCKVQGSKPAETRGTAGVTGDPESEVRRAKLEIGGVWMDGFAQMTPQERQLLRVIAGCADRVTLAFCLDNEPGHDAPWHSIWAPVTDTFLRCREELRALPEAAITVEVLERNPERSRFADAPALQHLEGNWAKPESPAMDDWRVTGSQAGRVSDHESPAADSPPAVRLFACLNPEAEVELSAREIRRHARENNLRFRHMAVLLRSLDLYHDAIRRVFNRYGIPFFIDRRESVAHHPLAELTRYALRIVAYGWEHDDWFGALKTGLVSEDDDALDRLENAALAHGWRGSACWLEPGRIHQTAHPGEWFQRLYFRIVPPFQELSAALGPAPRSPTGRQLAAALRELWSRLKVDHTLERWSEATGEPGSSPITHHAPPIHATVREQMTDWLRNLELAFATEALPLKDWLPVVEAGLGNLTVGVIPPALDQVLVGAIDRSRNPDLQIAFVLGVNEGIFPAVPPAPPLLNRADRQALAAHQVLLGPDEHQQIGLERYYGYIACSRARRQLVVTYAQCDGDGRELNPSPFVSMLQRLCNGLEPQAFVPIANWRDAEHWREWIVPWLQDKARPSEPAFPLAGAALGPILEKWERLAGRSPDDRLPGELVERVYGADLRTSVSGLEDFASCPFKFFAGRGLRAEERVEFEIDLREKGSFQHEVLKEFHLRLERERKRWRDLSPDEARSLVRDAGQALLPTFRDGLFLATASRRFAARTLIAGLEQLVGTLVGWAGQYQFDPAAVEVSFGLPDSHLPPWRIDLDGGHALLLRGRIDRIDVCCAPGAGEALGVVIDYKSSSHQIDPVLLHHGLELQLLAYLGALAQFNGLEEKLKVPHLVPAGAFYVSLKSSGGAAKTRDEEREKRDDARRAGPQHRGRFNGAHLDKFDRRGEARGDQFKYSTRQDGEFANRGNDAVSAGEFEMLLKQVRDFLRRHGRDIYAGKADVKPYRWKKETACDLCRYRAVCRFDPWTQPFNVLRPPPKEAEP